MAQNLSAPIAFVTLLHLCNERVRLCLVAKFDGLIVNLIEQNLKLSGKEDLSDFVIETED